MEILALPANLKWKNNPIEFGKISENSLYIIAGKDTDWFTDPGNF